MTGLSDPVVLTFRGGDSNDAILQSREAARRGRGPAHRMTGVTFERLGMALLAALIIGTGALAMAFVLQFGFGLRPCILCLYERVPYVLLALTGLAGLLLTRDENARRWLVGLCALILLAGAILGAYHVGVEEHWWAAATGCAVAPAEPLSIENLQAALQTPLKPCDQVDFRLAGLSLAGLNVLLSGGLATIYGIVFWQHLGRR